MRLAHLLELCTLPVGPNQVATLLAVATTLAPAIANSGRSKQEVDTTAQSWQRALDTYTRDSGALRSELLDNLSRPLKDANQRGDAQTKERLTKQRDDLNRDGSFPSLLDSPEVRARWLRARAGVQRASEAAEKAYRRAHREDLAAAIERFQENFETLSDLGAWVPAKLATEAVPTGWVAQGDGYAGPKASREGQDCAPLEVKVAGRTSTMIQMSVRRLEGAGALVLNLPDPNGGRCVIELGGAAPNQAPAAGGAPAARTDWDFTKERVSVLVTLTDDSVFAFCDGLPLRPHARGANGSDANTVVLDASDRATRFSIEGIESKGISTLPEDFFDGVAVEAGAKREATNLDSILTVNSAWGGEISIDSENAARCNARILRRDGDTFVLSVVQGQFRTEWTCKIAGGKVSVEMVDVLGDIFYIRRQVVDIKVKGTVTKKGLALDGTWKFEHPRQGTGKVKVKLRLKGAP